MPTEVEWDVFEMLSIMVSCPHSAFHSASWRSAVKLPYDAQWFELDDDEVSSCRHFDIEDIYELEWNSFVPCVSIDVVTKNSFLHFESGPPSLPVRRVCSCPDLWSAFNGSSSDNDLSLSRNSFC